MQTRIRAIAAATLALPVALALANPAVAAPALHPHAAPGLFPVAPYAYTDVGTDLAGIAASSGQNRFTVAFVLAGSGCQASWNGDTTVSTNPGSPDPVEQTIAALRAAGGDASVSFGGAAGTYLDQNCTDANSLAQQYEHVVDATGVSQVDFDIEQGLGDQTRQQRVAAAIAALQQHESGAGNPVRVTYTLGVGTNGLPGDQLTVVQDAVAAGVSVSAVNIMVMDYGPGQTGDMAGYAESAATAAEQQLEPVFGVGNAWGLLGLTPMIGPNDTPGETFTLADANTLVSFARGKGVGMLAFWEMGNDNPGYTGQANWAYTQAFAGGGGTGGGGISSSAWYQAVDANSGSCVDAAGRGTADGTAVQQWACGAGQTNQQWQFVPTDSGYLHVVNRNAPGESWDVTGGAGATGDGMPVQLWSYVGGTNQQWQPVRNADGTYTFRARHSGKCLDVPGASTADGARLQQYTCNGTAAQSFRLVQQ